MGKFGTACRQSTVTELGPTADLRIYQLVVANRRCAKSEIQALALIDQYRYGVSSSVIHHVRGAAGTTWHACSKSGQM